MIRIKLLAVHRQTITIVKWIALPLAALLVVALLLLLVDVLNADLEWDDGTRLNPVLALVMLSAGFMAVMYSIVFGLLAAVKLIMSWNIKKSGD